MHADEDPVAQAFVQRRTDLTQEQWDTFLSRDAGASNTSLSTILALPVLTQKGQHLCSCNVMEFATDLHQLVFARTYAGTYMYI